MNVEELREWVFEKKKCPYHITERGKFRTLVVFDKEGMNTYVYEKGQLMGHSLKPFDEITNEDLIAISNVLKK